MKQLPGFLGLTGYYRKFVAKYAHIVAPLTKLLKKNGFNWGVEADSAFERLKFAMTQTPILALLNFSKLFMVETNAFNIRVGILTQEGHRLAYFSKKLNKKLSMASLVCESYMQWLKPLLNGNITCWSSV